MKIIEKTVQEISLDTKDLENKQITFRFRCDRCSGYIQTSLRDLFSEDTICYHCSNRNLGSMDLVGLDIK